MRKTKICKRCNITFITAHKRKKCKYCSRDCYWQARWGYNQKCKNCSKMAKYRFCSKRCNQDFWNKNGYKLNKKEKMWKTKLALLKELGGKCRNCGITDIQVLDINHIDRNKKERPPKLQYTWQSRLK